MRMPLYLLSVLTACIAQQNSGDVSIAAVADNTLSRAKKEMGWILLFDGKSLDGWKTSSSKPSQAPVEDGCINPHGCGGYMMIHEKTWANFVLALDFKISKGCNSGFSCGRIRSSRGRKGCRIQRHRGGNRRHEDG